MLTQPHPACEPFSPLAEAVIAALKWVIADQQRQIDDQSHELNNVVRRFGLEAYGKIVAPLTPEEIAILLAGKPITFCQMFCNLCERDAEKEAPRE